jgi:hypothetical protein
VLVDRDPDLHADQQPREAILAPAERQRPVVNPVELQQVRIGRDRLGASEIAKALKVDRRQSSAYARPRRGGPPLMIIAASACTF